MTIPGGVKKVIFPLGLLFLSGTMWFGLYKPEFSKISRYRNQPESARQKIEGMRRQLVTFELLTDVERIDWANTEKAILSRIPKGKQIPEFYANLSGLAELCSLKNFKRLERPDSALTFQDGGITRSGFDLELTFDSEYTSLVQFLNGLRQLERLVEVVNLEVTRKAPLVGVKMVVRSYFIP
jgi:Tfp pilus assembly protein PilO